MVKESRTYFGSTVNTNLVIFTIKEYSVGSLRKAEQDTKSEFSKKEVPPMSAVAHTLDSPSTLSKT